MKRSAAAPLGTNLLPPLSKTEVQGRGEAEVSASNRYENVASLEKGHALLFNKDCQWVRLIRNKMETVSLGGQAEVICVRGENRIVGSREGAKREKKAFNISKLCCGICACRALGEVDSVDQTLGFQGTVGQDGRGVDAG